MNDTAGSGSPGHRDGRATIVVDSGIPNKNRAETALTIYRDAMRGYIAPALEQVHGPNWVRSQVLNNAARERSPLSYDRRLQSLQRGTPPRDLIDLAEIPFLIQDNARAFPNLDQSDTRRMHMIRDLRNEIQHADRSGDCTPEETASIAGLCVLALERCGLADAAANIRNLSLGEVAGATAISEAELRQQRERREWDKRRLAHKSPEDLTPLEQQRLADIEWEEEWERRESEREQQEQQERENQERERQERERQEREQQERERREKYWREKEQREHQQQERKLREWEQERSEREEIAQFGDDFTGLRRWFNDDPGRRPRHASEHARLRAAEIDAVASLPSSRLSAGHWHSLVLHESGMVAGWGSNENGQCDAPEGQFVAVSAGGLHSMALRRDSTVVCWGDNADGQCRAPSGEFVAPSGGFIAVSGRFIAISAGGSHSVGLLEDGTVVCWGDNEFGQRRAPSGRIIAVSAGARHSVALREDGTVVCWGDKGHGRCDAPQGQFVAVSAGLFHSMGLRRDGTVACWGDNKFGQCDAPPGKFIAISAGGEHSVALSNDGKVVCWGNKEMRRAPSGQFLAVSAGGGHSVALRNDGTVTCWGLGGLGECDAVPTGQIMTVDITPSTRPLLSRIFRRSLR